MTPAEILTIRRNLSLSAAQLADRLGVTERTVNRWLDGSRRMPEPSARLLMSLVEREQGVRYSAIPKKG